MCSVAQSYPILLRPYRLHPTSLLCPWDFPGKNTGVGCHFLLQGNLPNPGASRFFPTEPPGKPKFI